MRIDMKFSEGSDPTLVLLYVDNKMCDMTNGRIGSYVYRKPLSQWLHSYSKGMRQWSGLFLELSKEVNTKTYDLWISASNEILDVIQAAALESECVIRVFPTERTSLTTSTINILDELLALAKTRFLKKSIQGIQEMVRKQPSRIVYGTSGNAGVFQMQLPNWIITCEEYAIPLAFVSSYSDISEIHRIVNLSALSEERLLICIVNSDESKCVGIGNECRNALKDATVFQLNKLKCQSPAIQKDILNNVTEANARFLLGQLYQESEDADWLDAEKVQKMLFANVNQEEREHEQQREQCIV